MSFTLDMTGCEVHTGVVNIFQCGPQSLMERLGEEDGFLEVRQIETRMASPESEIDHNIEYNIKRNLPRFHEHLEFQNIKDKSQPIAIVGGGPSLEDHLDELRLFNQRFDPVIAAGSSHDYLLKNEIIPTYTAACDPDVIVNNYFKTPHKNTQYLIASCCAPEVFDNLKNNKVYLWHSYSDKTLEWFQKEYPTEHLIGGGCTVGLRSINLAIMLGYTNIHLFGFDSCVKDNKYHAYGFVDEEKEILGMKDIYQVKIGRDGKKIYKVIGYQLAQADHFRQFLQAHHNMLNFTFHGEGFLRAVYDDFIESNNLGVTNG